MPSPLLPSPRFSNPLNSPGFRHLSPSSTSALPFFLLTANRILASAMSFSSSPSPASPKDRHDEEDQKLLQVLKYHNQTKHAYTKYARGPHGLDWANQPNPFRRYIAAPILPLSHFPVLKQTASSDDEFDDAPTYASLFSSLPPPKPICKATISQFFYDSLALSAWKTAGFSTWSLRVNPSSGNLHPTEAYLIAPAIKSLSESGFVAHYAPKEHSLEVRAQIPPGFFSKFFPENSFLIGLSSIFWREAWKYGERAFRYCNHDVGHAIAAVAMAAAELGWDVKLLDGLCYKDLKKLMGFEIFPEFEIPSRPVKGTFPLIEFEHPDCVLAVFPNGTAEFSVNYEELSSFRVLPWDAEIHAALFVHRVVGLPQGLYFLVRNEDHFDELKRVTSSEFKWTKPDGCPSALPLYELEAHAVDISATGIGCFFDDPVHETLGFKGSNFQSLYHFTVGGPVLDKRIMSLPAYPGPNVDA